MLSLRLRIGANMGIKIEKASQKDAHFIAKSIVISSRAEKDIGIYDLIFEPNSDDELVAKLQELVTTETKSCAHISNFLIAYDNGERAGCISGCEPRVATSEKFTKALSEVGIDESYKERIAAYTLCLPELGKQRWMLDYINVEDAFHELSIIKELIQKSLLNARLKGYRKASTLIEIGCAEVELIYKKLGFSFETEKRSDMYLEVFSRQGIMLYTTQL